MDSTVVNIVKTEASRFIKESWAISPTSVYGFLVAFLVLMLVVAGIIIFQQNKKNTSLENKLTDLLAKNISVIEAFTNKFDGDGAELQDVKMKDTIRGVIHEALAGIKRDIEKLT